MPKASLTIILLIILTINTGCSVGMALHGKPNKDPSVVFIGSSRKVVLAQLGRPESSVRTGDNKIDSYLITQGNERSLGRAMGHITMDALTFGLWEVVGTPLEMKSAKSNTNRFLITYNDQDIIKDISVVPATS